MGNVKSIEQAVESLPPAELAEVQFRNQHVLKLGHHLAEALGQRVHVADVAGGDLHALLAQL